MPTVASTVAPGLMSQQMTVDTTDSGKAGDLQTKLQRVARSLGIVNTKHYLPLL